MGKFVQPRSEKAKVLFENEWVRVVKIRTQIHTGEWNKQLIVETFSGTDAMGRPRWVEITKHVLKSHLGTQELHEVDWQTVRDISDIICREEAMDDWDYILYINRGRYRVKGDARDEMDA